MGNVAVAYEAARSTSYIGWAYWFAVQDIPKADLFQGLVTGDGRIKLSFGAYRQAVLGPPPVDCAARPRVAIRMAVNGDSRLHVTVSTSGANNQLRGIHFGSATNALIDAATVSGSTGNAVVPLTAGTQATQFFLPSAGPEAVTAPFVVPDRCSDWHGFAGGGAGAFLP